MLIHTLFIDFKIFEDRNRFWLLSYDIFSTHEENRALFAVHVCSSDLLET